MMYKLANLTMEKWYSTRVMEGCLVLTIEHGAE